MFVSLNLHQIRLYLKSLLITVFFIVSLKNQSYFITNIPRFTEQIFYLRLVTSCFLYMNLNPFSKYSYVNHLTKHAVAVMFLHAKITLFSFPT